MPNMTLDELADHIDHLPATVEVVLQATAYRHALAIAARAAAILRSKTHGTGKTARAIRVLEQLDRKQYLVNSPGDPSDPANLPMWLEYGTRYMLARAYMRPAADAAHAAYVRDMTQAALTAIQTALE